ncbi:MAG TPA: lipopolysaccharide kinase InaA family protein [Candidatus Hydrogenedentes bacterium]|nr:lipopolysaccharide kinase InaA family protein [Candidatus Hydrogenedentota bacterium]HPG68725.1 lipopolysaccharide kinase InaA family protein [Candidatus Hydrogenedentota bacterium]
MAGMSGKVLRDYVECREGPWKALVRRDCADVVAAALIEGRGCEAAFEGGRGTLLRFAYPDGYGLIRRYLRGGVLRHVLRDAYLFGNRPLRELLLHSFVYDAGLAVPKPLGAAWRRAGVVVRGAIATHEVDAVDLATYAERHPTEATEAAGRCGALIRQMHDLGVWHADLQVRNILVGTNTEYLIDFDKARVLGGLDALQRARNLFRLRRSIEKNGLSRALFQAICEGYGAEALPEWTGRIYRAKGAVSDALAGRERPRD